MSVYILGILTQNQHTVKIIILLTETIVTKNISSELMRIFKNDSLPDLLLEKIVASATDTSEIVMLEDLKTFVNNK